MRFRPLRNLAAVACTVALVAGCSSYSRSLPGSGPSEKQVIEATQPPVDTGIILADLSDVIVKRAIQSAKPPSLVETLGGSNASAAPQFGVGMGDVLEVSVWEAPPAALFGGGGIDPRSGLASATGRVTVLPEQVVGNGGTIYMPFAGSVRAAGRTTHQIEEEITNRLKRKANDPQVLVRIIRNMSSSVTVVGEVAQSQRLPLTSRGERLLDALAAAGGTKQPVGKITLQVTREVIQNGRRTARVASLPLDTVITDPAQNIILQPGDVVTALHQPNSMTFLGATTRNEEVAFEAQGITLAQALGRAGGLQDQRANPQAVFIFRFEDPAVVGVENPKATTADGRVPVIYRANLRDPATFFMAQGFPMRNKDILYVSDAPAAELQKFLNIVSSIVVPTVTIRNLTTN